LMDAADIPAFVSDLIEAGFAICAVGRDKYVIDLSLAKWDAWPKLEKIAESYGDRDFLKLEIVVYLRSIGRYLDVDTSADHWSEHSRH
jgi:hypothetical protein